MTTPHRTARTFHGSAADLDVRDRVRQILANGAPPRCRLCGAEWAAHAILCNGGSTA